MLTCLWVVHSYYFSKYIVSNTAGQSDAHDAPEAVAEVRDAQLGGGPEPGDRTHRAATAAPYMRGRLAEHLHRPDRRPRRRGAVPRFEDGARRPRGAPGAAPGDDVPRLEVPIGQHSDAERVQWR